MKTLANLKPAAGSNHSRKRLGRGIGSGLGKTAGKGHKGQKARSGGVVRPGFEGGQTPLYRRSPKFGFTNQRSKIEYSIVNVGQLNAFDDGTIITPRLLFTAGIVSTISQPVKILNNGVLTKKLQLDVEKISKAAIDVVTKLGGTVKEK